MKIPAEITWYIRRGLQDRVTGDVMTFIDNITQKWEDMVVV